MLCAWPLSQSQACEAVCCVEIVEPRHIVGGAQSRVCNLAESASTQSPCNASWLFAHGCLSKSWATRGHRILLPTGCHDAMPMGLPKAVSERGRGSSAVASRDRAGLGILTHDPKQNIRSRLILPFHPSLNKHAGMRLGCGCDCVASHNVKGQLSQR